MSLPYALLLGGGAVLLAAVLLLPAMSRRTTLRRAVAAAPPGAPVWAAEIEVSLCPELWGRTQAPALCTFVDAAWTVLPEGLRISPSAYGRRCGLGEVLLAWDEVAGLRPALVRRSVLRLLGGAVTHGVVLEVVGQRAAHAPSRPTAVAGEALRDGVLSVPVRNLQDADAGAALDAADWPTSSRDDGAYAEAAQRARAAWVRAGWRPQPHR